MLRVTRSYIETLTNALSDGGVKFEESEKWHTDIEKKIVSYNPRDLQRFDALTAKGLLIHETGHIKYTDAVNDSLNAHQYPVMKEVYNALEDGRIELKLKQQYGDFAKQALTHLNSTAVDVYTDKQRRGEKPYNGMNEVEKLSFFMNIHNNISNSDVYNRNEAYQMLRNILEEPTTAKVTFKSIYQQHGNRIQEIARNAITASNTQSLIDYIDSDLFPLIKDLLPEANKDYKASMSDKAKQVLANPVDSSKEINKRTSETLAQLPTDEELRVLLSPYTSTLTQKLLNVLKEKLTIKYTGAYKRGRLLSRNVYKVITDEPRIFSRRNKPEKPDYAVTIILDESGSMAYENAPNAYTAGLLLDEASKKLGFKMKYIRYESDALQMPDISEYRKKFRGGGNNEAAALQLAEKITDKTDDNLVFLFTDGGVEASSLKGALDHINKAGNYTVIGVGVALAPKEQQNIQKYFPVFVNAENVQQLPIKIIGLLQHIIHR